MAYFCSMWKRTRVFFVAIAFSLLFFTFKHSQADNTPERYSQAVTPDSAARIYAGIDFGDKGKLNAGVFRLAYKGYRRLLEAGKILQPGLLTVIDYSLSSNTPRLWVLDLVARRVVYHSLVAHGQGTGEEYATQFSNRESSHQSSLGFYTTGNTYQGQHGLSLYLHGMDRGFNDAAYARSVVLHGASYVSEAFIRTHKRLGRSWGCPAVAESLAPELIRLLQGGTCLFAYFPDKQYLSASHWLTPAQDFADNRAGLQLPAMPGLDAETKL